MKPQGNFGPMRYTHPLVGAVEYAVRGFRFRIAPAFVFPLLAIQFAMSTSPNIPSVSAVCIVLAVVFRIGVVLVPTDKPDASVSSRGRLHLLFAIANFAAIYSLAGVVITVLPLLKRVFGLLERVFLLAVMLWFLAANMLFLLAVGTS